MRTYKRDDLYQICSKLPYREPTSIVWEAYLPTDLKNWLIGIIIPSSQQRYTGNVLIGPDSSNTDSLSTYSREWCYTVFANLYIFIVCIVVCYGCTWGYHH